MPLKSLLDFTKESVQATTATEEGGAVAVGELGNQDSMQRRHGKRDLVINAVRKALVRYAPSATTDSWNFSVYSEGGPTSGQRASVISLDGTLTSDPVEKPRLSPPRKSSPPSSTKLQSPTSLEQKPLTASELHDLFSGAPVFSVSKACSNELPEAKVTFPFDSAENAVRLETSLRDCVEIAHEAWMTCTTRAPGDNERMTDWKEADVVREVPSIVAFQGLEPGSVGWEYFLTSALADEVADDENELSDLIDRDGAREAGARRGSVSKGGVRTVEIGYVVERLRELGDLWWELRKTEETAKELDASTPPPEEELGGKKAPGILGKYTSLELYSHLFTHLLYPPTRISTEDYHDPYSLKIQIASLVQTLEMKHLWLNFADMGWRIRLGQVLWGDKKEETHDDSEFDNSSQASSPPNTEKIWLLLQILLGAELAIRIDAVFKDDTMKKEAKEISKIVDAGTRKLQWDIILARRFLDSVLILSDRHKKETDKPATPPSPKKRSWFGTVVAETPTEDVRETEVSYDAMIAPRHYDRQLAGLLYFAESLGWPGVQNLSLQIPDAESNCLAPTPLSIGSTTTGFFPNRRPLSLANPAPKAPATAMPRSLGWLSRTYLTGLVLPGEGLSHFIISALLENDPVFISKLGYNANLYAGFQYDGFTYWSSYCVVGRVLAGFRGSREAAGWVGGCVETGVAVDGEVEDGWAVTEIEKDGRKFIIKGGIKDGWIDVVTAPPPPLEWISKPENVQRMADPTGGREVTAGEFEFVRVGEEGRDGCAIELKGLMLRPWRHIGESTESLVDLMEDEEERFEVGIEFLVDGRRVVFQLRYDVSFITSFPCIPTSSSSFIDITSSAPEEEDSEESECEGDHPILKSIPYSKHSLRSLLGITPAASGSGRREGNVMVVEIGTEEERVFVKAWCCERGLGAVMGRKGRSCLGCCVRMAWGLGVGVVVWEEAM
ncbi:hypothetical protein RUND412_003781 [Rhizina undulata]